MSESFFISTANLLSQYLDIINSTPVTFRIICFALYSLAFGSLFGSILNRRVDPLKAAQREREYILLNYGTDVAPEIPNTPYENQKRSICPNCKNGLRFYHNIPLLSFILLNGKCGFCDQRISISYPLIELSTMCLMVGLGSTIDYQLNTQCIWLLIFSISIVSICFTDIATLEVYDIDSVAFCVSALAILNHKYHMDVDTILTAIYVVVAVAISSSIWGKIRGHGEQVIGSGDFPLMAMFLTTLSIFTQHSQDIEYSLIFALCTILITPVLTFIYAKLRRTEFSHKFPLAPALTIGTSILLLMI